ncbi:hypothetical protein FQN49_007171 [Arthroderma sp. PD_2]|nr:hypothetical protein FQN49_007171 [Arthroderma sp. PD_2]
MSHAPQKPPLAKEPGSGKAPSASSHIRIARPSQNISKAERFYVDGLGLKVLWRCGPDATGGHPLLMLGWPGAAWHLELVDDSHAETPAQPTEEDLLVIYVDESIDPAVIDRLVAAGGERVTARNEYWEEFGVTVADPDGYRLVLSQRGWANEAL